jgi:hypothetical protein
VVAATLAITAPTGAFAYDEKSAIRDCEKRLSDEYKLSDFRHQSAKKLPGEGHKYVVKGETKIEGAKHPFGCDIADRHVTAVRYDGPEPEGLGTAEKLAIGAAAAIAAGVVASEMSKDDDKGSSAEASAEQMKSCKNSVAEKFTKASMADISVSPKAGGKHNEALVGWTVDLDGAKTHGTCTMSDDSHVLKFTTTDKAGGKQAGGELEQDGFYYDKHVGKWRDPDGEICHTCTPENGFPKP